MSRPVIVALLFLLSVPAQAAFEVGADIGAFTRVGHPSPAPTALFGVSFAWRFAEAHALGLGLRSPLPQDGLPAPRLQYAVDFDLGALRATLPLSLGLSPDLVCVVNDCRLAAEARAGFGVQVFDDFRAPWLTLEMATPLARQDSRTVMIGLHVSVRWEPLPEDLE